MFWEPPSELPVASGGTWSLRRCRRSWADFHLHSDDVNEGHVEQRKGALFVHGVALRGGLSSDFGMYSSRREHHYIEVCIN